MVQTYHFSIHQVYENNLKLDSDVCLDCPLSYTNNDTGKSKCYTHKGLQGLGLRSMLKRLNKILLTIEPFDKAKFNDFLNFAKSKTPELVRFGTYGEPILLHIDIVKDLAKLAKHTGYTHQWNKDSLQCYKEYFMASTHNAFEANIAIDMNWKVFNTSTLDGAINCPASKESSYKSTCAKCALCSGTSGKGKKNIYINLH
mgnify:CR=1 FL=1